LNYLGVCAKSFEYYKFASSFCQQLLSGKDIKS